MEVLNRNVMRELIGDDNQLMKKFELEFLKQARESMRKITGLYNNNQVVLIKEEAHFLKTSAKAVGAELTADILQQLELIAQENNKAQCKDAIVQLNVALKQVYGAVRS